MIRRSLTWLVHETGLRFLKRRKAATGVAILTMALALGSNTAVLAVLKAFLLSSFGLPEPDRVFAIVPVRSMPGRGSVQFSDAYPNYQLIREAQRAFADVATFVQSTASWDNGGEVRPLQASRVTASFFRTMRVAPIAGRVFEPTAEGPTPVPVVLISNAMWRGSLASDRAIIGRSLTINGAPHTVIGVMPPGFTHPLPTDIWLPFSLPQQQLTSVTGARNLTIYGRLKDGMAPNAADADLVSFTKRTLEANSTDNRDYSYTRTSIREFLLPGVERTVLLVQAAALVLLLLAIVNLSSLLIAWGFDRQTEMATRLALGAQAARLARMTVFQSVAVVVAGSVGGLLLGIVAIAGLKRLAVTRALAVFFAELRVDLPLITWSLCAALIAGILAGLAPGWIHRRLELARTLRSSSRGASISPEAMRWQKGIVVLQTALSVVILIGAALLGISFRNLTSVPMGFSAGNRIVARVQLGDQAYGAHGARVTFAERLLGAFSESPQLETVAFTSTLPIGDQLRGSRFFPEQQDGSLATEPILFHFRRVSPNYLAALGVPLLQGRAIDARDDAAHPPVAVVSRALASRLWTNANPIGKHIFRDMPGGASPQAVEVVGVVGDVRDAGTSAPMGETVYMPYAQVSLQLMSLLFTSRGTLADAVAAVQRALRRVDPALALSGVVPLESLIQQADALPRLRTLLLGIFAAVALAIALLGAFGVISQLVANREREFAIRLVFGAAPRSLMSAVLLQAWSLTIPGIILGSAAARVSSGFVAPFTFEIAPQSIRVTLVVAIGVLFMTAMATLAPALRAMRVRPDRAMAGA